jgi:type I restriction enzyme S subunit
MQDDWPIVELGSLVDPSRGISYGIVQPGKHVSRGVPILRVSDVRDGRIDTDSPLRVAAEIESAYRRTRLRGGELLITIVGTVGETAIVPNWLAGWNVARAIAVVPVIPEIGAYWIALALRSPLARNLIDTRLNTTVQATLNLGDLAKLPISLPPREVRQRIIAILSAVDEKIELNRRMNETLEAMARAIFNDWFVDFGPTRAKMEGRAPYLAPEIWSLFPDVFDNEGKPRGWRSGVLEDVLSEIETGSRPRGGVSGYTKGIPSIGAESIVGLGVFDYSKTKYIPQDFFDGMKKGHIKNRDVILYKDGGRPGEFEPHLTLFGDGFPFKVCAINEHVYRLRTPPDFGQSLLYFWLSSDHVMEEMRIKGTGVAIPGLNSTQVKTLSTRVPTQDVAKAFNALVDPLITRILANCTESQTLTATRDLLLPKLMSGEIRVKDAEKIAEAAQ